MAEHLPDSVQVIGQSGLLRFKKRGVGVVCWNVRFFKPSFSTLRG